MTFEKKIAGLLLEDQQVIMNNERLTSKLGRPFFNARLEAIELPGVRPICLASRAGK
jgi:hypothetical protein